MNSPLDAIPHETIKVSLTITDAQGRTATLDVPSLRITGHERVETTPHDPDADCRSTKDLTGTRAITFYEAYDPDRYNVLDLRAALPPAPPQWLDIRLTGLLVPDKHGHKFTITELPTEAPA